MLVTSRRLKWLVLSLQLFASPSFAQPPSAPTHNHGSAETSELSPRAAVSTFFAAARKGNLRTAAAYIDLPTGREKDASLLALRVKVALDRYVWIDVESLSPNADGYLDDGLLPRLEEIGRITRPGRTPIHIRLVRTPENESVRWKLSRNTVLELEDLYENMPDRWVMENLPPALMRTGPATLMWWQWLTLPWLVVVCALLGRVLGFVSRHILSRLSRHTRTTWDDALVSRAKGPLALLWAILVAYPLLPYLSLSIKAQEHAHALLKSGAVVAIFWSAFRSVDLAADMAAASPALQGRSARALLPVMTRIAKVLVFAMLIISVLSGFGLPVASLLAGLGVGGIALALAAQKTVENVFGAVSIGVDVPFQVGDVVRVGDLLGTVEAIGLRSTRIRTADRTLVTFPNGTLADARIESLTARDRIRFNTVIGLEYGTKQAALKAIIAEIEALLRANPKVMQENASVRFIRLGASSLDVEVNAWFLTREWPEFEVLRQETLLGIMDIVESKGSAFAFPTQTVHLRQPESREPQNW